MAPPELYQPNWQVRAVSVPGPDTDLSLYVSFDNARFLFGCGEGTQRAFSQKRMTMRGLSGVFVGSGQASGRAGLAGVLMTAADAGLSKVDIIGPPDISQYLATLRSSVLRDALNVHINPFPRDTSPGDAIEVFKSRNITVRAIALTPTNEAGPSTKPDYGSYEPMSSSFRPSRLSPTDAQRWCNTAVGDMFQNGPRARASRRPLTPPPSPSRVSIPLVNPYVNPDGSINAARADTRAPIPLPSREDVETEMVYICQAPDVRGKFNVAKADALGVPKGPARGQLARGESIEVADAAAPEGKRTIKPEDCLVGGGPGSILIMINCSERNIDSLLANPTCHQYQSSQAETVNPPAQHVHVMVHRVPKAVWQDSRYQAWMAAFGDKTNHLIADPANSQNHTVFNSAAWNTLQLSILNDDIFTPPYLQPSEPSPSTSLPPNTAFLEPTHVCKMHPPAQPTIQAHHDKDIPFRVTASDADQARQKLLNDMPDFAVACEAAKAAVLADPRSSAPPAPSPGDDIVVTTLGTGSALPSKYRNVSATYLEIPDVGGILLDAGEGTLGQFRRRFGEAGMAKVYKDLKMIFISHMHADHHLGLNAILEDRFKVSIPFVQAQYSQTAKYADERAQHGVYTPLYVVAPPFIALNLQESASWQHDATEGALENVYYMGIQRLGFKIDNRGASYVRSDKAAASELTEERGPADSYEQEAVRDEQRGAKRWPYNYIHGFGTNATREHWRSVRMLLNDLGLTSIWAPVVPHRGKAYGLALEHSSGWKIVYSGDTKPSEVLVEAGQGATLLIHEATLEDDKPEVAAQKGHSTFGQAIDVGKEMGAKHILLNHFSQRYPKLPKLPAPAATAGESTTNQPVISISFDFMSLRVGDMWKMAHYMDAMSMLFAEVEEEGEGDGEGSVLGAVIGDVNPSIDGAQGAQGAGNGGQKKSKKAMRKEAQKALKNSGTNASNGAHQATEGKRPCSPSNPLPEGKKSKGELKEVVQKMEVDGTA